MSDCKTIWEVVEYTPAKVSSVLQSELGYSGLHPQNKLIYINITPYFVLIIFSKVKLGYIGV